MDSPAVPDIDNTAVPADTATENAGDTAEAAPPALPDISAFWPDAPHRAGPPADHYEPEDAEPVRIEQPWQDRGSQRPTIELRLAPRQRRIAWKPVAALVAAVLVAGGLSWYATRPPDPGRVAAPVFAEPSVVAPPGNPPVSIETSAPAGAIPDAATFELADGTTELDVRIGEIAEGWYEVSSPPGSGINVRTEEAGGAVRIFVDDTGDVGTAEVDVVLSPEVVWSVLMRGGVRTAKIDLTGARVGRVDLLGGAANIDLALPKQKATVPISMSGGIRDWRISTGGQAPVRAELKSGAGTVVVYGKRDKGVNKGARFTAGSGAGGIDLVAEEGVGTLTVAAGPGGGTISG
ncbi:hypothetical protein Ait01nite_101060 [Actinoplanes italicus]|uniref:hypothetical protein n=1 Tax=Actinoplanes italicus TaxID=113567 RepID=UPI0011B21174|nr:hypothetical protein [Actinoplanes italicus]GIE37061.1 hypothetical protein Ait01nite_101060 [Actinoplanes italicus]